MIGIVEEEEVLMKNFVKFDSQYLALVLS